MLGVAKLLLQDHPRWGQRDLRLEGRRRRPGVKGRLVLFGGFAYPQAGGVHAVGEELRLRCRLDAVDDVSLEPVAAQVAAQAQVPEFPGRQIVIDK